MLSLAHQTQRGQAPVYFIVDRLKAGSCEGSTKPCRRLRRKEAKGKFNKLSSTLSNQTVHPSSPLQLSFPYPETALLLISSFFGLTKKAGGITWPWPGRGRRRRRCLHRQYSRNHVYLQVKAGTLYVIFQTSTQAPGLSWGAAALRRKDLAPEAGAAAESPQVHILLPQWPPATQRSPLGATQDLFSPLPQTFPVLLFTKW